MCFVLWEKWQLWHEWLLHVRKVFIPAASCFHWGYGNNMVQSVYTDLKTNASKNRVEIIFGSKSVYRPDIDFRQDIDRGYIGIRKNHTGKKDIDFWRDNDLRFQVKSNLFHSSNCFTRCKVPHNHTKHHSLPSTSIFLTYWQCKVTTFSANSLPQELKTVLRVFRNQNHPQESAPKFE